MPALHDVADSRFSCAEFTGKRGNRFSGTTTRQYLLRLITSEFRPSMFLALWLRTTPPYFTVLSVVFLRAHIQV